MSAGNVATQRSEIARLAEAALATLPDEIRRHAGEIAILVEEMPDAEVLYALGTTDPWELTGLYEGTPLTEKSIADSPLAPDIIRLYRQPILREWRERGDVELGDLVAHVLVHELAHHFGWSDADIARIDRWWE